MWITDFVFGLRSAPNIFSDISDCVVKIVKSHGVANVINYLDDFIIVADSYEECLASRHVLTDTLMHLGFTVSWKKVTEPAHRTTFLGIEIDSSDMSLTLPDAKVLKLKASIMEIYSCRVASKKQLESIGGQMAFCSRVVRGGRTFSRRIFDACKYWFGCHGNRFLKKC